MGDNDSPMDDSTTTSSNGPAINFSTPTLTKRSVTLPMLLAAGILKTGEGTMSLEYHVG